MAEHNTFRMFSNLQHSEPKIDAAMMKRLADKMTGDFSRDGVMPTGMTYFGQLISHDINPSADGRRTLRRDGGWGKPRPQLNLDSIYGDEVFREVACTGGKFKLGEDTQGNYGSDLL